MLNKTGVPTLEQVKSRFPENNHLKKHKAITECYEEIPCNPCSTSCPFNAIHIGEDINTPPKVDFNNYIGCGICVYSCPGLAIITVEEHDDHLRFKIPYEFVPYPIKGEHWNGINRNGDIITEVEIIKVSINEKYDKTALIEVKVQKEFLHEFVTIRRKP